MDSNFFSKLALKENKHNEGIEIKQSKKMQHRYKHLN